MKLSALGKQKSNFHNKFNICKSKDRAFREINKKIPEKCYIQATPHNYYFLDGHSEANDRDFLLFAIQNT